MALAAGTRLGVYEILDLLGAGGMGEVYRARDTKLERDVAIKVLPELLAGDPDRVARFEREAKTLASLNHPNIAQIYGLEAQASQAGLVAQPTCIVMELVEGPTLADRIAKGPIPLDEALPIARQIAEAVEAAHEQGIIHRDLKPANVKVRPDGTVKVLDFGLAKLVDLPGGPASSVLTLSQSPTITTPAMTMAGAILGTAAYMSPEQARGKPVDKRADIWAFGCVLYEMLTGRRAFNAEDVSLTLAEIMKSEPDWSALPTLPPAVLMCLRRSLKKDPRQRLRDIGEARIALEGAFELERVLDSSGASPKAARRVWLWVLPSAAMAAIAAATLTWSVQRSRLSPLPEVIRFQIYAPAGSKIPPGTPAVSPDGRTLAYVVNGPDGTGQIYLREMGSTGSRPLPGTENAVHPFWSPDGRSLAFVSGRVLKRIEMAGGPPRELTQVSAPWQGSWNQFGDLLFIASNQLSRVPAEGGNATPAITIDAKADELGASFPYFLPDGKRFLTRISHGEGSAIHLASIDSLVRKLVLDDVFSAPLVAPTPRQGTTYLLYMRDDALVAHEFDEGAGEVRGTPRLVVDKIGRVAFPALMPTVGVSPAGVMAYQTGSDFTGGLSWVGRDGKTLDSVELSGANPTLSPDGRLVAAIGNTRGEPDVWVTDLARSIPSRLTGKGGVFGSAIWSPDSHRVAFARPPKIYVTNVDKSTDETVLAGVAGVPTSWSQDGKYLAYSTPAGKLFLWPLAGGGAPIAVGSRSGSSRDGQLSPDGKYIAYVSDESGRDEVYLQPLPPATGRIPVSAAGGTTPRWSQGGRELLFLSRDLTMMAVDVPPGKELSAGVPRKLFQLGPTFGRFEYAVSADGQRFLVARPRAEAPDSPITVVLNWWVDLVRPPN